MTGWLGILGAVVTTLGVIIVALLTRRSAKDQTAVGGFTALVKSLQDQNDRQEQRIRALEQEGRERRRADTERDRVVQVHQRWDFQVARRLRQLTDEPFPDPPPLDVETV